jgi:hypothetical protein
MLEESEGQHGPDQAREIEMPKAKAKAAKTETETKSETKTEKVSAPTSVEWWSALDKPGFRSAGGKR